MWKSKAGDLSAMTRIDCRGVNKYKSYTTEELQPLLHVNKKTIYRWIEKGLKVVPESKKPLLIRGSDLKEFHKNKDSKKKFTLKKNEFNCLKCKAPRRAKRGSIETFNDRKTGICSVCNGKMSRTIAPYQKGLLDTRDQHSNVHYQEQIQLSLL